MKRPRSKPAATALLRPAGNAVSIFPIQLLHSSAPSQSDTKDDELTPISLPEIEFEDCTSYISLGPIVALAKRETLQGSASSALEQAPIGDRQRPGRTSKDTAFEGNKRVKLSQEVESDGETLLAMTRLRFEILARDEDDKAASRQLTDIAQRQRDGCVSIGSGKFHLRIEQSSTVDSPSALLTSFLVVEEWDGCALVRLPIVNTDKIDCSRTPHRFSNGRWLEVLPTLAARREYPTIRMEFGLHVVTKGPVGPYSEVDGSCFLLEARLRVYLRHVPLAQSGSVPNARAIDCLDRLIRFGFPFDEHEATIRTTDRVDSNLFYRALRSPKLPDQDAIQPPLLNAGLFPFQKRSVRFLLGREGKMLVDDRVASDGSRMLCNLNGIMGHDGVRGTGLFWRQLGTSLFYNAFSGSITTDIGRTRIAEEQSGILAEEMGLGKTVEVFALLLLNSDPMRSLAPSYFDKELDLEVWPTKTTLVVAPEVLRQQWLDEAGLHASALRTYSYLGYQKAAQDVGDKSWADFARQFDLMVLSFDTLRKELAAARKEPSRSRRFERKYERQRSPLVQLAFHRVVMDEVQLVGHTGAAETASMIARQHSIAVSGTPLKEMTDLRSLFKFLRVPGPIWSNAHWSRLLQPSMAPSLISALGMLATRFTKEQVRQEMTLPQQTRVLVPIGFTAIEQRFYRDGFERMLSALGIDPTGGIPSHQEILAEFDTGQREDFSPLRSTLLALRQACTHPQVAGASIRGTALATSQTIRSMDEVLTIMIEGSKGELDSVQHALVQKQINRIVLLLQDKSNVARLDIAKAMLTATTHAIDAHLESMKADLQQSQLVGPLYRFDATEEEREEENGFEGEVEGAAGSDTDNDDGEASLVKPGIKTAAEREAEQELASREANRRKHLHALRQRRRNYLEQLHRCHHFMGNIYFQMGESLKGETAPSSTSANDLGTVTRSSAAEPSEADAASVEHLKILETESYAEAEKVRNDLLKDTRRTVEQTLHSARRSALDLSTVELQADADFGSGGMRSTLLFDMLYELQVKLNEQAKVVLAWRRDISERLEKPVNRNVSEEDELDDQYQENLDAQTEAETLLEMYRVLLGEREYLLTGLRASGSLSRPPLYVQLDRQVPQLERAQQRLLRQQQMGAEAEDGDDSAFVAFANARTSGGITGLPSDVEICVMRDQLNQFDRLNKIKNKVSISPESRQGAQAAREGAEDSLTSFNLLPLEQIQRQLRDIIQNHDGREEIAIARTGMEQVRKLVVTQKKLLDRLRRESAGFSVVWNARAAYFKQIQDLSDQVGDIVTNNVELAVASLLKEERVLKMREDAGASRLRYLRAIEEDEREGVARAKMMEQGKAGNGVMDVKKTCPMCTEVMVRVVMLDNCGHSTCESCYDQWTARRGVCPMCKVPVNRRNVYRTTYDGGEGAKRRVIDEAKQPWTQQKARFNVMDNDLRQSLNLLPIHSTLGSKLDLLTRHLQYIQREDPLAKSLIFTAFSKGLSLVGSALRQNDIQYVSLESGGIAAGRAIDTFKTDPTVNVLLLHSEVQSSGLNLTCATTVHMLEPLLNHSLELQAIGRVHRIGQTRATTVYCYEVMGTVEQRIVELARERNLSLFTLENCVSRDVQDGAEMAARAKSKSVGQRVRREGEFVAELDDIVSCLFDDDITQRREHSSDGQMHSIAGHVDANDNGSSSSRAARPPTSIKP